ncbi:MAG: helix-turn-helix domain-containing protein [Clostridiales bacterium]|jgi:hypothetical protein|nr:helix-turn-helix domain-containing protein [Eubacteriales bacterium]MDH7567009.1 helix-turn-helix domain-containing protein [Clostridiales bacterium]
MGISINFIADRIKGFTIGVRSFSDKQPDIIGIKLFDEKWCTFQSEYLYVGKSSELPSTLPENQIINILCIEDTALDFDSCQKPNLNLLVVKEKMSVISVFNEVQEIVLEYGKWTEKLSNALMQDKGLKYILSLGEEFIGNPVCIVDCSLKLLSISRRVDTDDIFWKEILEKGYFSQELVHIMKIEKVFQKLHKSYTPFLIKSKIKDKANIMATIVSGTTVMAYMSLLEYNRPFLKSDVEPTAFLAKIVSREMQKDTFYHHAKGLMYEYLIADLLDGKLKDRDVIHERLKLLKWPLKQNLYVMSVTFDLEERYNSSLEYTRDLIEQNIFGSKAIIFNGNIVLVISRDYSNILDKNELKEIDHYFGQNRMYGGLSRCFHDISEIQIYFNQSLEALEIGIRLENNRFIFEYEDYVLYHIVNLCNNHENLISLCHPSLIKLIEYDRKNNTLLAHSLKVFLQNERNLVASAQALHIHRNTMVYRIDKIQEIIQVDLNDSNIRLHFNISYKFLEYIDRNSKKLIAKNNPENSRTIPQGITD